ncbi:DUF3710 domain-containing protein [Streptomyces sp. NPDC018057]|uniref:DUF3710 domain-containing protein n=1 Tax=unclassified Streptomyces TaxID=2593676 RepID=UPI0037A494D6
MAEAERINDRERRWARQLRAEREHRESLEKALAEALRSRTAPPDQPDQPTPAGTTAPPSGPWDRNDFTDEDEDPCDGRIDMGGLLVPEVEGMELRVEVAGGTIVAATVVLRDSAIQFQAFAAPRHEGIWDGIREEIAVGITGEGGSVEDVEGPLGRELRAVVPIQLPDGSQGHRTVRFVGADGPRWFLRGVISGRAAVEQEAARDVEQLFRDAVVVRGHGPLAPRDPIALRMPPNAETVAEGQAPQQRTS